MKVKTEALIADLIERTRKNLNEAENLKQLSHVELNWKPEQESWSMLECIEHLNLYGDFYLPEIENRIRQSKYPTTPNFKSGWLGNYFAKSMLPREKLNKMKTFKDKNPLGSQLDKTTLDRFIQQQKKTLDLLDKARKASLNRTKTSVSISKWITLKLGDTFRVVIYHNQRHLVQALNVLKAYKNSRQVAKANIA
jgi:hypothetical protein